MGDNYHNSRGAVSNVPERRIQSHYSKDYEELIKAFGQFMHNVMPVLMKPVLERFLPGFLSRSLKYNNPNIVARFSNIFHTEILKYYQLPENLTPTIISSHINGGKPIDANIPTEIVMVYGESGVFLPLISDFIDIFINSGFIDNISSWEALEAATDIGIARIGTKDSTIFSNSHVRCGGKAFSIYMFKLLAINYLLYKKYNGEKMFIPSNFYSNVELKDHFEANLELLNSEA